MLSIGICDDSQDNRQSLRWLLESILEGKNIEHTIFEFSSGETLLQWDQKHPNEIDLLFLDIEMGSVNGMETASQLREKHSALQIVFVTGFSDYVFDGYRVGALGYLMKPAKRDQLEEILSRFLVKLCQDAQPRRHFPYRPLRTVLSVRGALLRSTAQRRGCSFALRSCVTGNAVFLYEVL